MVLLVKFFMLSLIALSAGERVAVRTNVTLLIFDDDGRGFTLHGIDPKTNTVSENAFVVSFSGFREVTPEGEIVQLSPAGGNYSVNLFPSRQPAEGSDILYEDAFRIDIIDDRGIQITFWMFTKEQEVTDKKSARTITVAAGSLKYSLILPLWPFLNEKNTLQAASFVTTLIPDTITGCFLNPDTGDDVGSIVCEAGLLTGIVTLFKQATTFNYVTNEENPLNVDILFFVCPLEEKTEIIDQAHIYPSGEECTLSFGAEKRFPFDLIIPENSRSSDDSRVECEPEKKPTIRMVEMRVHYDNFINSALDYDPEMTVLFGAHDGGSGECDSDKYIVVEDYIFWVSLSCFILAIILVLTTVCIGGTTKGRELITGRTSINTVMKNIDKRAKFALESNVK